MQREDGWVERMGAECFEASDDAATPHCYVTTVALHEENRFCLIPLVFLFTMPWLRLRIHRGSAASSRPEVRKASKQASFGRGKRTLAERDAGEATE